MIQYQQARKQNEIKLHLQIELVASFVLLVGYVCKTKRKLINQSKLKSGSPQNKGDKDKSPRLNTTGDLSLPLAPGSTPLMCPVCPPWGQSRTQISYDQAHFQAHGGSEIKEVSMNETVIWFNSSKSAKIS